MMNFVSLQEESVMLTASQNVADLYGLFVLKQKFHTRKNELHFEKNSLFQINYRSFIPFSKGWKTIHNILNKSRVIYYKSDLTEIIILLYFGGLSIFKKAICGVRSPMFYENPRSVFDFLHNFVFKQFINKRFLSRNYLIHVLSSKDKKYLSGQLRLENVIEVPNDTVIPKQVKHNINKELLEIIFIGELIERKGVQLLIDTINESPANYIFHIVGKGRLEKDILQIVSQNKNCIYHGYLSNKKILSLLPNCDIFFLPSYGEGLSGAILEAMSCGLKIVDSPYIYMSLPKFIEYSPSLYEPQEYIKIFQKIYKDKRNDKMMRIQIRKYCEENYSSENIRKEILAKIFELKPI